MKEQVPSDLIGCKFEKLFEKYTFLYNKVCKVHPQLILGKINFILCHYYSLYFQIPMALYRTANEKRGNSIPYVYTCPDGDTLMEKGDEVFFIGCC